MHTAEIQGRVDAIATRMTAAGLRRVEATAEIIAHRQVRVVLSYTPASAGLSDYQFFRADTMTEALDAADAWVAALPSPEELKRQEFLNSLAATIEIGRQNGIDVAFVNPLIEQMKALSENAIEHHR